MVKTNSVKAWLLATRPKTLSAAAVPVMIGTAFAWRNTSEHFNWIPAILCLLFAWIMQIVMFVLLGAFSSIKDLIPMLIPAIWIAMILTFVARPIAVLISLAPFDIDRPSKAFVSWAGIKGAVPIVFAFYPLVHGIYNAQMIFDIVMVVTCISVLVQGSTLKFMAGHLKVLKEE